MRGIGQAMRFRHLADVLYALAGVEVFGISPFAGLTNWADELVDRANDAYAGALNAQTSANFANSQIAAFLTDRMASEVPGGIALSESFGTAVSSNLGANYTRRSVDVGNGTWGPNGSGLCVWTKNGGNNRYHFDRRNDPLATDYQIVRTVNSSIAESSTTAWRPKNYLRGRINAGQTSWVFAAVEYDQLLVGFWADNNEHILATVPVTPEVGDTWLFYIGTAEDDREFIVKQNNIVRWQGKDEAGLSYLGADYRYVGLGAHGAAGFGFFSQRAPATLDAWAAADRLPATI